MTPGYPRYSRARTLPDSEIVALYLSGLDADSVGFRAGCSGGTVLKIVKAAGHVPRKGGGRPVVEPRIPREEMAALYRAGLSMVEIGERAGISADTVRRHLAAQGITARGHREIALRQGLGHRTPPAPGPGRK